MRRRTWTLLFLFLLIPPGTRAQLSPLASVSVLTCSPGTELYSVFGHSAIRVKDPALGMDLVFNYGTFDFETPDFYMKFIRGRLNYMLSVTSYEDFEQVYIQEGRSIYEQELQLSSSQKDTLFNRLKINYRPENRYYLYDFFFDNCATRIRDIIDASLHDSLEFVTEGYTEDLSFRQLIDPYVGMLVWADFGIDLALGAPSDRKALPLEYMFLPDYVLDLFRQAYLPGPDQARKYISAEVKTLYQAPANAITPFFPGPGVLFWALFAIVLIITVTGSFARISLRWFDAILFSLVGLVGWFLLLLWFATDHIALNQNQNLIWAIPLYFPAGIWLLRKNAGRILPWFFTVTVCLLLSLFFLWPWVGTRFSPNFLPVLLILLVRAAMYSRARNLILKTLPFAV